MVCPYCKKNSKVTNSRPKKRSNTVWRRRKCLGCGAIWTTLEHSDYATIWRVRTGKHLLTFRPESLLISLYEALKHKKTPDIDAQYICNTVIEKLQKSGQAELSTALIKKTAYDILRRYDKTAAAVYKATYSI